MCYPVQMLSSASELYTLSQLLYTPQMILTILTAASFAHKPDAFNTALLIHVSSWVAQFAGHFLAEGRSPALLDNLVGGACFSLPPLSVCCAREPVY